MSTNYRALCAQMLQVLAECDSADSPDLIKRVSAALAKSEPTEIAELSERLLLISDGMAAMGYESDSWAVARAASLLQQLTPTTEETP